MLRLFYLIQKDLKLILGRSNIYLHSILLGLVLIFLFSLSRPIGGILTSSYAATIFWISSNFSLILIFNALYLLEQENNMHEALNLSPLISQEIWIAKAISGLVLLLLVQIFFIGAVVIFLGQQEFNFSLYAIIFFFLINIGLTLIGSLLGALSYGYEIKESFLSLIIFPLVIPLLLAGIKLGESVWGESNDLLSWFRLTLSFDLIYLGGGYILFPFIFSGE